MKKIAFISLLLIASLLSAQTKIDIGTQLSGFSSPGETPLPNVKFIQIYKNVTATGNVDLYTVPSGKRAILASLAVFNNNAGSTTVYSAVKIGAVYFPIAASTSIGTGAAGSRSQAYVAEAGEIFAINTSAQPNNVVGCVIEFDNTAKLKTVKITSVSSGDNTVYTVPTGKTAVLLASAWTIGGTTGVLNYGNLSGANRTVKFNVVPSGGTVGTTNVFTAAAVVSTGSASNFTVPSFTMTAGDFISVNTDAATASQIAFVTVIEI